MEKTANSFVERLRALDKEALGFIASLITEGDEVRLTETDPASPVDVVAYGHSDGAPFQMVVDRIDAQGVIYGYCRQTGERVRVAPCDQNDGTPCYMADLVSRYVRRQ